MFREQGSPSFPNFQMTSLELLGNRVDLSDLALEHRPSLIHDSMSCRPMLRQQDICANRVAETAFSKDCTFKLSHVQSTPLTIHINGFDRLFPLHHPILSSQLNHRRCRCVTLFGVSLFAKIASSFLGHTTLAKSADEAIRENRKPFYEAPLRAGFVHRRKRLFPQAARMPRATIPIGAP